MENINKNRFFRKAKERALHILRDKEKLKSLMKMSKEKLKDVKLDNIKDSKFVDRVKVILRMVKAYVTGAYRDVQIQNIVLLVGALVYFVTPIDLIADFIPITGYVDDFTVIALVYAKLKEEIDRYILWEEQVNG